MPLSEHLLSIRSDLEAYALRLTKDPVASSDLLQDTYLKVLENLHKFQPGTNFKAWSLTIMHNCFVSNYRRQRRGSEIQRAPFTQAYLYRGQAVQHNAAESHLQLEDLFQRMARLPILYRLPLMYYLEGLSYQEIAELIDIPLNTVKSRIRTARQRLR